MKIARNPLRLTKTQLLALDYLATEIGALVHRVHKNTYYALKRLRLVENWKLTQEGHEQVNLLRNPLPQVGDEWEVYRPGKKRLVKQVGAISGIWSEGRGKHIPYVNWKRLNKGRYSGLTVYRLMQWGRRLSTKAERDKKIDERLKGLNL